MKKPLFMYDVFISYSWHYKKSIVDDLYAYLISNGLRAWKADEDEFDGSTVQAVRHGLQNSMILLICASNAYFDSHLCRRELELGIHLGKMMTVVQIEWPCTHAGFTRLRMYPRSIQIMHDKNQSQLFMRIIIDIKEKMTSVEDALQQYKEKDPTFEPHRVYQGNRTNRVLITAKPKPNKSSTCNLL